MSASIRFRRAGIDDIPVIQTLAAKIWPATYASTLSPAQLDYMFAWMYASDTITAEISRDVQWELIEIDGEAIGYFALEIDTQHRAKLHKLYLMPDRQGFGLGQIALARAQDLARDRGCTVLGLGVKKTNARAIRSYERAGFRRAGDLVSEIGGGFVMDDYLLERSLMDDRAKPRTIVKICGLSTPDTLEAAIDAGADLIGLVFFPKSPRHVSFEQAAVLAGIARGRAESVALTVDADDALIDRIVCEVAPDRLQLHGQESPSRVGEIRARFGRPIIKAIGVSSKADIEAASAFGNVSDMILFDAKPRPDANLPGGNGLTFDWSLLAAAHHPFMLSGGLSPTNVHEALRVSGAAGVDVSSGVESESGRKDAGLIRAFVEAARA